MKPYLNLTLLLLGSSLLFACGAKPKTQAITKLTIGPQQVQTPEDVKKAEDFLAQTLQQHQPTYATKDTRGVNVDQAKTLVDQGQGLMKAKNYLKALNKFQQAQKLYPNEDHLLLISAVQHLLFKTTKELKYCKSGLMSWQRYLKQCKRCQQATRYRDRAVINANSLGSQCGAWTSWESAPSRAKVFIDEKDLGRTPLNTWLPIGKHSYRLTRSNLSEAGHIELILGQQKQFQPQLSQQEVDQSFQLKAELKCMRPNQDKVTHSQCSQNLNKQDLFTLKLISNREVYLYLFVLSDRQLTKIYPYGRNALVKADKPIILPQQNAWQIDDSDTRDELWLLASTVAISELENVGMEETGWHSMIRELASQASLESKDMRVFSTSNGQIFVKWLLRLPSQKKLAYYNKN